MNSRQKQIQNLRDRQANDWLYEELEGTEFMNNFDKQFNAMRRFAIGWVVFYALFMVAIFVATVLLLLHFFG